METTTSTPTTSRQDPVKGQFAAALRQYQYYSHGRSLRKFCEDESRFISPDTDPARRYGQISWTDFTLGEGETFATRNGEIDINLVKVVIRSYPVWLYFGIFGLRYVRRNTAVPT